MARLIRQIKNMYLNNKVYIIILSLCICPLVKANEPSLTSKWNKNLGVFLVEASGPLALDLNVPEGSVLITGVLEDSTAYKAGLKRGDIVLAAPTEIWNTPGKSASIKIRRGGQELDININTKEHNYDAKIICDVTPGSEPRIIVVDQAGKGDCRTITGAMAIANHGDTILVKDGIYREDILPTNGVKIQGKGLAHIEGMMPFRIFGFSEITIEVLTITGTYNGINIVNAEKITINNCNIAAEGGEAISVRGSNEVVVKGCSLNGKAKTKGIVVSDSKVKIIDNMIFEYDCGILLKETSQADVLHNLLDVNKSALGVYDSNVNAKENSITGKMEAMGIYLENSEGNVEENSVRRHDVGIGAKKTKGKIVNNSISQNNFGIFTESGHMEILDNLVLNNINGIGLFGSKTGTEASEKAVVVRNKISRNIRQGISAFDFRVDIHYNLIEANGAGISVKQSTADIRNNTIVLQRGNGISIMPNSKADIYNNIVAFNSVGISSDITSSLVTEFNDVYGNLASKEFPLIDGNYLRKDRLVTSSGEKIHILIYPAYDLKSNTDVSVDPKFLRLGNDYRLRDDSPLVEKRGKDGAFIGAFPH